MKLFKSQAGHFHISLIVVAVLTLVGLAGLSVYSKQAHTTNLRYATADGINITGMSCDDIYDNLTDDQLAQLTDAQWDQVNQLCDSTADDPGTDDPTDDPGLTTDTCGQYTDAQLAAMTDDQYNQACGLSSDDSTDPGDSSDDGSDTIVDTGSTTAASSGTSSSGTVSSGSTTSGGAKTVTTVKTITLTSKTACLSTAKLVSLKPLQIYGLSRVAYDGTALTTASQELTAHYSRTNLSANFTHRAKTAHIELLEAAKKAHKKSTVVRSIKVATPANHQAQLVSQITAFNKVASRANTGLKTSKSSAQAAAATCSAFFDSPIDAYLTPKIHAQENIDTLTAQNAAYNITYQTAAQIAKIRGKPAASLTSPATISKSISSLQKSLSGITVRTPNARIASGDKAPSVFTTTLTPGSKSIEATIKQQSKLANSLINSLR